MRSILPSLAAFNAASSKPNPFASHEITSASLTPFLLAIFRMSRATYRKVGMTVHIPAQPTSSRARRSWMGERMRITAPKVPGPGGKGGPGIKYGRETFNPWRFAIR